MFSQFKRVVEESAAHAALDSVAAVRASFGATAAARAGVFFAFLNVVREATEADRGGIRFKYIFKKRVVRKCKKGTRFKRTRCGKMFLYIYTCTGRSRRCRPRA